ncbi:MAG: M81 family metallopeptidase [Rikenellaceae bacterium]
MKSVNFVAVFVAIVALCGCSSSKTAKPRVAIVGVGIECSTFSPAKTTLEMFNPLYGDEIIASYPFFKEDTTLIDRAEWLPTIMAWASPGGIVTRETYDTLLNRSLRLLEKSLPLDAIFLDIHGAMSVEGLDDPEGDYSTKIRELVGDDVIISASMDPHGCVSQCLAENVDLITSYRMSPHEDRYITRKRAIDNLLERLDKGLGKPQYKAWVKVPILLPGEKTSTRVEPGKSLYEAIVPIEEQEGITDAAIWMSYPWSDEPRNHGVVVVVGDDKAKVESGAKELAEKFWSSRNDFEFVAPTASLEEVLANALKSDKKPYFISDMGDNPTAGGAGDVTWTLEKLLARKEFKSAKGKRLIYASIPSPELVAKAKELGEGAIVEEYVGAKVDNRYAAPIKLKGKIEKILDNPGNAHVVVRVGSIQVIVTEKRMGFHYEANFSRLGLDPRNADIIVVKLGYLTEELYDMRGDWMMAQTRGGVDQELEELPYKRIDRPMYPLDKDMDEAPLEVVFIP